MQLNEFATFALAVCCGVFTQAATGFAGGLVIMPCMVWAGHGIPEAQAALLVSTIPQNLLGIYRFRDAIIPKQIAFPASIRLAMLPLGVAALYYVDGLPQAVIRQFVCGVVAVIVLIVICLRPKSREHVHPVWTWLAFSTSGFFAGLTATGGPMMVLWVQAHDWSTERTRGFLFSMYTLTIPVSMTLLYFRFGQRILIPSLAAVILIPGLVLVTHAGLRIGSSLGRQRLRAITMTILLIVGVAGVIGPML